MSGTTQGRISDAQAVEWLRRDPGEVQASLTDPFEATHQTVQYMCDLIRKGAAAPIVQLATQEAVRIFRGGPLYQGRTTDGLSRPAICESIWWYVKHAIKFVHHQVLLRNWLNRADELQLLIAPDTLLRMERPRGDCAVFTTLICSMLDCAGISWDIVTVAADPELGPDVFSHVYPRAMVTGGMMPLDASHGKYPGWEVPSDRVLKLQAWDQSGNPISDRGSRFNGLHGVNMRGFGCCGGLGQDQPADMTVYASDYPDIYPSDVPNLPTYNFPSTGGSGGGVPSSFWSGLTQQGLNIFGQVVAPTTTLTRGPNGQMQLVTPAGQTANAALLATGTTPATASSYMPLILMAGLGLVLVLALGGKK